MLFCALLERASQLIRRDIACDERTVLVVCVSAKCITLEMISGVGAK